MTKLKLRVAIQGQQNSYHHQALLKLKPSVELLDRAEIEIVYCSSFEEAFGAILNNQADYALLAIENGVHGHIYQTLDIIMKNRAKILAEVYLPVHHQLAGVGDDLSLVTDVYSHFAAFPQCDKFLEQNLPGARHHVVEDTSFAAELVKLSEDESKAAICSNQAAEQFKLNILASNIENFNDNVTRFFLLGKQDASPLKLKDSDIDKTSLILTTSHRPGSLFKALEAFYKNNLNLSSLTSRPGNGGSINYRFYIEIESDQNNPNFKQAMEDITNEDLGQVEILGSY